MPWIKSKPKPRPELAVTTTFEAIGTSWQIDLYDDHGDDRAEVCLAAVQERIDQFDLAYSRFRPDSLVSAMARKAGEYDLPADAGPMIELYQQLYDLTDAAMTPLIGQTLVEAGYDSSYSLRESTLTPVPAWPKVASWDGQRLALSQPALLDFGAAGKGYLVDLVSAVIEAHGFVAYTVDAGGDLKHRGAGREALRVGLEHPDDRAQVIGLAAITDASLCGSAGNRRRWGRWHHVVNPHTMSSPEAVKAVWVVAAEALMADALTTALFFVEPAQLLPSFDFEYVIIYEGMLAQASPNWPGQLYS